MTSETLHGTLNPDGSLQLEHRSNLPPGRVEIVIHSIPASVATNVDTDESGWHYLERVHTEAVAAGGPFRSSEDIERERASFRENDDEILCEVSDEGQTG